MAFTCIFIFGFNLKDIIFVEIATIIGQATLTVIGIIILFGNKNILKINIKDILTVILIEHFHPCFKCYLNANLQ